MWTKRPHLPLPNKALIASQNHTNTPLAHTLTHLIILQHVEDKLHHDIVLNAEYLRDTFADPRLDSVQTHFTHVNLTPTNTIITPPT